MSAPLPGVALVPFGRQHLAQTLQWTNDPELARLLDRHHRVTAEEHERWFASLSSRADTIFFAVEDGARHIGNVWLADINTRHRKAEVRIVLAPTPPIAAAGRVPSNSIAAQAFGHMNLHRALRFRARLQSSRASSF